MKNENRDRMGDKFEREMADLFQRIGFIVRNHVFTKKENGRKSEQDVLATKGNLKILIQCKDYAKFPFENIEEVINDLIEDGESLESDKLILAITGHKNLSEDHVNKLKRKGVYLWNEKYWRKLQKLDLIDLYEEIGKNLEIKNVLKRVKDEEEKKLNSLYDKIDKIEDKKRKKSILEQLEDIEFSDYTKREIQLRKIENEILLEKEKEVDAKAESKTEDIELEELFSLVEKSDFNFNKRYLILDKIRKDLELSKKSGKIIDVEKIKTFIERQEEDSSAENWGDNKLDNLEELRDGGKISQDDYEKLRGKVKGIGVSKKGEKNAERKNFEYKLKKAKSLAKRKKIFKIVKISSILLVSLIFVFFISLFFKEIGDNDNSNNLMSMENITVFQDTSLNSGEQIISLQEEFCKDEFAKTSSYTYINNYNYFEDSSTASDWLDDQFPNEGPTINRARFLREWYFDRIEFPIYILEGTRKTHPSSWEQGIYFCDRTGIVIDPEHWNEEKF
ncbi:MAG: hypothetical protein ABFQ65_02775 [Nanoarchaeota archaeon]